MSKIIAVVCFQTNGGIGYQNKPLFGPGELPGDTERSRDLTVGTNAIMGKETWESFDKRPPLNRRNIVITTEPRLLVDSGKCYVMRDPVSAVTRCKTIWPNDTIAIAGGENIYRTLLPSFDEVYTTEVECEKPADAHFPVEEFRKLFVQVDRSETRKSNTGDNFFFAKYLPMSKRTPQHEEEDVD